MGRDEGQSLVNCQSSVGTAKADPYRRRRASRTLTAPSEDLCLDSPVEPENDGAWNGFLVVVVVVVIGICSCLFPFQSKPDYDDDNHSAGAPLTTTTIKAKP
jgi:hypothetical protein